MKLQHIMYAVFVLSGLATAAHGTGMPPADHPGDNHAAESTYSLNGDKSTLFWKGTKPGGMHHGTVEVVTGQAGLSDNLISSGSFEIDLTTIRNEDIESKGMRERLVNHLKSEDFFHVDKYPKAYFSITGSAPGEGSEQVISGELTVRGNTHPISFPARVIIESDRIVARTGDIILDRTLWEVNYKSRSVFAQLKDSYIDDEMVVRLDIQFDR